MVLASICTEHSSPPVARLVKFCLERKENNTNHLKVPEMMEKLDNFSTACYRVTFQRAVNILHRYAHVVTVVD